jgi:AcrR family transcriptional regulator
MGVKSWRRAQVLGTRDWLIETAARMFGERGYAATPLEEVVAAAGLTRGAVYHHFADKRALFDAVVDRRLWDLANDVEKRAVKRAAERGGERESDVTLLFVHALGEAATHRILLVDGPAALGRERWSELMEARLLPPIRRVVELAIERGALAPELAPEVSQLVFGAVQQAALRIGRPRAAGSRGDTDDALRWLIERLLAPPQS